VACKGGGCDCDRRLVRGLKGRTKKLAVAGCSKFGVSTVSDLLEMDGLHVRTEMRAGGVWTNTCRDSRSGLEWVALMRTQLGVEDGRGVVSVPYAMPVEPLCVGAFIVGALVGGAANGTQPPTARQGTAQRRDST
jgi:hypothetical protein